ncbi:hypothetical protein BLA60_10485 [Actinophytocola xinjiangensis]|uniref:FAD-dependent oxidoreductase 2 FAD-binding domain-containing protein n=1 Tax=Actinophytocola xinjiangensis TaxID=485602 RepID=A0A7Z1AY83_9PSEU|nr:FAD-dependent oxidoreductase [Actinophytocola xinjiangensis]OLF11401.1 hypothetical protein BLA60_10485 [Actinophytocola xinjiangensis]
MPQNWDDEADVVVVGFGAAGACAAIEAAESGAEVVVLDRFTGGGASAVSGGVVYAGGGTAVQRAAGVTDSVPAMLAYLSEEVGDAVSPETLARFCESSAGMIDWLAAHGVPFDASVCPFKTSYPPNGYYLYYSGSEQAWPYRSLAEPAPRGHRAHGRGTSGRVLYAALAGAALSGARFRPRTRAVRLVVESGRVTGVECRTLTAHEPDRATPTDQTTREPNPPTPTPTSQTTHEPHHATPTDQTTHEPHHATPTDQTTHETDRATSAGQATGVARPTLAGRPVDVLNRLATKPGLYVPALARRLHRGVTAIEARWSRPWRVRARRGVVLAAGGYVNDRALMREHAPAYRGGLPLGTRADDGSGIRLGVEAGGVTARLSAVSAWRFLTPPSAFVRGALVDGSGRRFVDESSYGAAIGDRLIARGGRAWLLVDAPVVARARAELRAETLWFQRLQARYLLGAGRVSAGTVAEVAHRAGVSATGLAETVRGYGSDPDEFGKHPSLVAPLSTPPYTLIDLSFGRRLGYPCPILPLGGLAVDERTGEVLDPDGGAVTGLYAAGRNAVGICSHSYVSGLSLADCVFSGRRAGHHAATGDSW